MRIKKIIASVMCIGVISSGFALGTANAAVNLGDVNGDNKIDSKDAVLVLKDYAENLAWKSTSIDKTVADVNSDNSVDSKDAVWILRYYANTLTGYEKDISEFIKNPPVEPETKSSSDTQKHSSKKCPITGQYHYYGETASDYDGCSGWYFYCVANWGPCGSWVSSYSMMGDSIADKYAIEHGFVPNKKDVSVGYVWLG